MNRDCSAIDVSDRRACGRFYWRGRRTCSGRIPTGPLSTFNLPFFFDEDDFLGSVLSVPPKPDSPSGQSVRWPRRFRAKSTWRMDSGQPLRNSGITRSGFSAACQSKDEVAELLTTINRKDRVMIQPARDRIKQHVPASSTRCQIRYSSLSWYRLYAARRISSASWNASAMTMIALIKAGWSHRAEFPAGTNAEEWQTWL
jgi:hypothetical protein